MYQICHDLSQHMGAHCFPTFNLVFRVDSTLQQFFDRPTMYERFEPARCSATAAAAAAHKSITIASCHTGMSQLQPQKLCECQCSLRLRSTARLAGRLLSPKRRRVEARRAGACADPFPCRHRCVPPANRMPGWRCARLRSWLAPWHGGRFSDACPFVSELLLFSQVRVARAQPTSVDPWLSRPSYQAVFGERDGS